MTGALRAAYALLCAASAFLSALARRTPAISPPPPPAPHRLRLFTGQQRPGIENRCPVCRASFRGARICSRCGADLEPLMLLAVKAWQLRQAARRALEGGETGRALSLSTEAQQIQATGSGDALRLLSAWLKSAV